MIYDSTSHPSCRELSDRGVDGFWCEQIYMTTKKKKKTKKLENKLNEIVKKIGRIIFMRIEFMCMLMKAWCKNEDKRANIIESYNSHTVFIID